MIKKALLAAMGQELTPLTTSHYEVVAKGVTSFRCARQFQKLFPHAEHRIVQSEHDFDAPRHWCAVHDWLSRARLYDRYVVILSIAIDISPGGKITELKPPEFHVFEITKVSKGKEEEGGARYELAWGSFDDEAWQTIVESGDLSSVVADLVSADSVARFDTYWRDTQPGWIAVPSPG